MTSNSMLSTAKSGVSRLGQWLSARLGIFNQGPPDLDELWRDFQKRLNNVFRGGSGGGSDSGGSRSGGPSPKAAGAGVAVVLGVAAVIWLGSGIFIVNEGEAAVITQFGKYRSTTGAGLQMRLPYPIQQHEIVKVAQVRKVEIGTKARAQRTREALMLTDDENIVDIQYEVQYRIKGDGARDFLFNSASPEDAVQQAAESAMREVVGRMTMDSVLYESRSTIAGDVTKRMQSLIDRYGTGIEILAVAIQNAQPPEQVQAAFDDAVKAGQDRERAINEGQAYANDVIPRAKGAASRLMQQAEGHKSRVVETARGDASRFRAVVGEYNRAPAVTRDRMYIDAMQDIFSNTTKVLVESRQGNNLLYLPLDKIMAQTSAEATRAASGTVTVQAPTPAPAQQAPAQQQSTADMLRNREAR